MTRQPFRWAPAVIALAMLLSAVVGYRLRPTQLVAESHRINLSAEVPKTFAGWHLVEEGSHGVVDASTQQKLDELYSQLLNRTYVNAEGYPIMLVIAYGNEQRRSLVAHRPDVCYPAQGFSVTPTQRCVLGTDFGEIRAERLAANKGPRDEPVTFWFTLGGATVRNSIERRLVAIRYSLTGEIPDGLLFRVSSIDRDTAHGYAEQEAFVRDFSKALSPEARKRLEGLQ